VEVAGMPGEGVWEVAFERPTKRAMVLMLSPAEQGKVQIGQLIIADGKMIHGAMNTGDGNQSLEKQSSPITDPNKFTYRDLCRGMFLKPFDLALVFSQLHYMEVIENQIGEIKTLDDSEGLAGFKVLARDGEEVSAVYRIDPNTLIIKKFDFLNAGQSIAFKLKSVEIDKPLDEALFDFEKTLSKYETAKK